MDEYISKENILNIVSRYCPDDDGSCSKADVDLREMLDEIEALPIADIPPVDRWISVKNRLPETNNLGIAHILVYDKMEGVVKADFLDESAHYRYGSNIFIISNTSTQLYKVTHWQPLPEPPKDKE